MYVFSFNRISSSRQDVTEAWSDIDVQLKRRHDLIPNLVNIVKGYASYEENLYEQIASIRAQALSLDSNDIAEKAKVENTIEDNLRTLLAVAENYPDLKANTQFLALQKELVETEDEIASARRIYNSNVANFNSLISTFPTNLIASIHHFTPATYFQNE